jgi:hypothetical protein
MTYAAASMPTATNPQSSYTTALGEANARLASLRRWLRGVVWLRIASLVLFIALASQTCSHREHGWGTPTVAAVAFVALSVLIALLERRMRRHESEVGYYQAGLWRLEGRKAEGAPEGTQFADPTHPYAVDLDVFGPASLFSLLCAARTGSGQATLARWLSQPAAVDEVEERQRAVAELAAMLDLRRDLWLAGGVVGKQVREQALEAWLSAPTTAVSWAQRLTTCAVGLFGILALYAFVEPRYLGVAAIIVLLQRWFASRHRVLVKSVEANVF